MPSRIFIDEQTFIQMLQIEGIIEFDRYYTIPEIADMMQLSRGYIYSLVGSLNGVRYAGRKFYKGDQVLELFRIRGFSDEEILKVV